MELREFISLFTRRKEILLGIITLSLLIALAYYRLQGQWYQSEVLLSVARTAAEDTAEYRYDQFYRLQADERIADTIARYLESAAGKQAVLERAHLEKASSTLFMDHPIKSVRLSSQLMRVTYASRTPTEAERLTRAISEAGEEYLESLNEQAKDMNWFTLVKTEPVISDGRFHFSLVLLIGLFSGLFLAFWTAIGFHYWFGTTEKQETK